MKKYLVISVKYDNLKRGAFTASQRLAEEHSDYIDTIHCKQIRDIAHLRELNEQYQRIIFNTQDASNYSFPLNIISLRNLNYLMYSRDHSILYDTCNNGFYYTSARKIKHYIPFITDFKINKKNSSNIPCVGFYIRNWLTPDSFKCITDILKDIKQDVNIYTMGNNIGSLNISNKHIKQYTHTFNNIEFFKKVTHYIYPKSKQFQDPFPHTLIEAIQSDCQIICPEVFGRNHKDGIDDICEVTRHHNKLILDYKLDNINTIFSSKVFKKFFLKVFDNNFEHILDRTKYKYFSDWIEGEVL